MAAMRDLLSIERKLWRGNAEDYRTHLADDCLLAFVEMAGMSSREDIARLVDAPNRWRNVDMVIKGLVEPAPGVAILTYRASAVRGEDEHYRALISSCYVNRDGAWKLMFHQQTPLQE